MLLRRGRRRERETEIETVRQRDLLLERQKGLSLMMIMVILQCRVFIEIFTFLFPFNGPFFLFFFSIWSAWIWVLWMLQLITSQKLFAKTLFVLGVFAWLPMVSAESDFDKFPNVTFKVFSDFVQHQFSWDVSLKTVLIVLFSLTSNPDLLGLHALQQHSRAEGEIRQPLSGWIKVLSWALQE